jgi:hypothetical protein
MACTNCGCKNKPCGCEDGPLTTPAPCNPIGCPDPYPCSEVIDAQCVLYSGDPIICNEDTVVATNDTVADALNQVVDYFCDNSGGGTVIVDGGDNVTVTEDTIGNVTTYTINATCCPTFVVDISFSEAGGGTLSTTLINGTGPFTYEWTIEQNEFVGIAFTGPTNTSSVLIVTVLNNYVTVPALSGQSYSALVKVKVTDSVGQIATAYYNAVILEFPA